MISKGLKKIEDYYLYQQCTPNSSSVAQLKVKPVFLIRLE